MPIHSVVPNFLIFLQSVIQGVQGYYNVVKPDGAPDWLIRFAIVAPIPSRVFIRYYLGATDQVPCEKLTPEEATP